MASMGYNTIRLGVLWAGLEPVMGEYNFTYLEQVVECVNIAERYERTINSELILFYYFQVRHPPRAGHAPGRVQQEILR